MEIKKNLYRGFCNWGFPVLLSVSLFASCKDDLQTSVYTGPGIRFSVTDGALWHATRAAGNPAEETVPRDSLLGVLPLHAGDGGEGLYLHALLSDNTGNALSDDERILTRSAPVTDMTTYGNFGVFAYLYTGAWDGSAAPDFMYNTEVRGQGGVWSPTADYNWPGKGRKLRFFAYAPYNTPGVGLPVQHKAGYPDFTYTVPEKVQDQKDLLVAASGEIAGDHNAAASLTFRHALTAVRFVVGDDMQKGKVTGITLRGVYGKAVYSMEADSWSAFEEKRDFSQELDKKVGGQTGEEITPVAGTFMMIPQQLPEGAGIEVAFTDDLTGTGRTLTASIAGATWPGGKTVTYRISTSSISVVPTFTVTAPEDFTYEGGDKNYSVTSYASVSRAGDPTKTVPMSWTAEFVEDDGNGGYRVIDRPDWLTAFTANGNGGTSAATHSATITEQQGITSNPHNDVLKKAPRVNGVYDLSTKGGTESRNTANCYVINAPGTYCLPLVYGNAIRNGQENRGAYISNAVGNHVLKNFVNYRDEPIVSPYIDRDVGMPANATLVWQDEPDLVKVHSLSYIGDPNDHVQGLVFEVSRSTIKQGNAVVAVRNNSGNIMWSWHIWVTDFVPGRLTPVEERYDPAKTQGDKSVINFQGEHYFFMGVPIGWCDGDITTWEARSVKVRFTQAETGATQVITLSQKGHKVVEPGNLTYFQFGRKDPMLGAVPGEPGSNNDKDQYGIDTGWSKFDIEPFTIGDGIMRPHWFVFKQNVSTSTWLQGVYLNLWNTDKRTVGNEGGPVIKTIYDPSPEGYHVPPSAAFTGFTYNGQTVNGLDSYGSRFNSPYTSAADYDANFGWELYCNKMTGEGAYDTGGGTIFIPAAGYRYPINNGMGINVGKSIGYWSSDMGSNGGNQYFGVCFNGSRRGIVPITNYVFSAGLGVLPVMEIQIQ